MVRVSSKGPVAQGSTKGSMAWASNIIEEVM